MLGDFCVLGVLGQGGSGVVYDATWGPRRVALKVLHPSLVGTAATRTQFLQEAQRLQQIMHPGVVKVLAVGVLPDDRPFLAMERLDGETLASVIARGAIPLVLALEMFGELCSAVAALHDQGLVHRDLKPENVFVVAQRHAVLLDFGIAKDLAAPASTTTQEGNVRGTPAYMAPERFFGQPAGIATDVYELAVVLYTMLAGRLPWDDVADPETRLSPRALVDLAPVPEALDVEIRRALSTRVQNRPSSAMALLDAVRAAASAAVTEPGAADTARLRPGGQPSPSAEQHTPLAWAPTIGASKTAAPKRGVWIAGAVGTAAIAAGVVVWLQTRDATTPAPIAQATADAAVNQFSADDPWADRGAASDLQPKAFALIAEALTPEQYRAEAAAAVGRLPADTKFVFTTQLTELRANSQTRDMLAELATHPKVAPLKLVMPACLSSLVGESEWFVFAAPSLEHAQSGTLILRGRWQRADVETCFGDTVRAHIAADGAKLFRVGDNGWLDFIDDHTAFVTFNAALEAEGVHALVKKSAGPPTRVRQMLASLPKERSVTFVADGKAKDDWSMLSLPAGSDIVAWVRVEQAGAVLDLAADPHSVDAANAAIGRIEPQLDDVFKDTTPDAVGRLEVVREGTVIHIKGNMTSLMLGIVTASLSM